MCTVLVASRVYADVPLVVAANRDEQLDRPAAPPSLWKDLPRPIVAPRDLRAGGTWLGLNADGLFVAITNRFGGPRDAARRSRGEIVVTALGQPDAERAAERALRLDPTRYNGFHLLLADRAGAAVVWSDGSALHHEPLAPGVHHVTERSFDAARSPRHDLLDRHAAELAAGPPPDADRLAALLSIHTADGFDGTCVHVPTLGYGTRSSTLLWLAARGEGSSRLLHADGPPCRAAYEDHSELFEALAAK